MLASKVHSLDNNYLHHDPMRTIKNYLNKQLTEICQQTLLLETLTLKINACLPPALQGKCQVGSFNKGCLIITTFDAVWATPLRFALPELRDGLRRAGLHQLTSITVKVIEPVQS